MVLRIRLPLLFACVFLVAIAAEEAVPGVWVQASASGQEDGWLLERPALAVEPGDPLSPFLPIGPWQLTLQGRIATDWPLEVRFRLEGRGEATLHVGEQELLPAGTLGDTAIDTPAVAIDRDGRLLTLSLRSAADGGGRIRLLWSSPDFSWRPVPPGALSCTPDAQGLARHAGRQHLAEQRCIACHAPPSAIGVGAMPELHADAPSLLDAGGRLRPAWLAAWLRDPAGLRPDARMPDLLHGAEEARDAADLAAWLAGMGGAEAATIPAPPSEESIAAGRSLYTRLRCASCHSLTPPEEIAEDEEERPPYRVPLDLVGVKYTASGLIDFLRAPRHRYRHSAMPDFGLNVEEAAALAAFLEAGLEERRELPESDGGDAQRGAILAARLGCANCHALPAPRLDAPALSALDPQGGCLAEQPSDAHPRPNLDVAGRAALRTFLAAPGAAASLGRSSPQHATRRLLERLRCADCHQPSEALQSLIEREADEFDLALPDHEELAEQGVFFAGKQRPPLLSQAGAKLRGPWLRALLAGETTPQRPYLHARMPPYPAWAELLTRGLVAQHGLPLDPPPEQRQIDPELAAHGARLVAPDAFACRRCHAFGPDAPATEVFENPGLDLATTRARLRRDWTLRFLHDPLGIDDETGMPAFADREGRTGIAEPLDGDATAQFIAVWHHLLSLGDEGPAWPEPAAADGNAADPASVPLAAPTVRRQESRLGLLLGLLAVVTVLALLGWAWEWHQRAGSTPDPRRRLLLFAVAALPTLLLVLLAATCRIGVPGLAAPLALAALGLLAGWAGVRNPAPSVVALLALLWAGMAVWTSPLAGRGAAGAVAPDARGADLFARNCAACHGLDGSGVLPDLMPLRGNAFIAARDAEALAAFIIAGRPAGSPDSRTPMPMLPRGGNPLLSDAEVLAIARELRSWQEPGAAPSAAPAPTTRGELIVAGGPRADGRAARGIIALLLLACALAATACGVFAEVQARSPLARLCPLAAVLAILALL